MPTPRLRRAAALLAVTVLVPTSALSPPAAAVEGSTTSVFINEMHYDNSGTDAGEFIEVAGPAGTSLGGWSLVLYNGNGGAAYDTDLLSGTIADQQGGYGTVALSYPTNGIQNGSPDGVALVNPSGSLVQFLSYEGTFTAVGGPADGRTSTDVRVAENGSEAPGQSLWLTGTGSAYGDFVWASPAAATPGAPNPAQTFGGGGPAPAPDPCQTPVTHAIPQVQGAGFSSGLTGTTVTLQGVVVGDFQEGDRLGGIFLQDAAGDGDATTSDGIFVEDPDGPAVVVGDVLRVTGTVAEAFGITQITSVTAAADCGDAAPVPSTPFQLPADSLARERVEGMHVSLVHAVTATETFNLARFGELVVSSGGRLYVPTNGNGPTAAQNDLRRLVIDDASTVQNPDDIPFASPDGVIRLGDTLVDVVGVMSYGFGEYRLQPTQMASVVEANTRTVAPEAVGGDVQVASFNVLNYFTTVDDGDPFPRNLPRGADSDAELARQRAKIVEAIAALDADVVGLMEIENDEDDAALNDLVAALNIRMGTGTYAPVEEPEAGGAGPLGGTFGDDAIKVAMIYKPAVVRPLGPAMTTTDPAFFNARLPLAQAFKSMAHATVPFTVVVNHFKSKSCGDPAPAPGDANADTGQGCFNGDRLEQAGALVHLLEDVATDRVLIIGDLNSYGEEDPIDVLERSGLADLVDTRLPETDQYSYVFEGEAGYLDHALATPALARRVTGVDIWHINADEPRFLDYNTEFNPPGYYRPDAYRSSDHDPVLVGLDLGAGGASDRSAKPVTIAVIGDVPYGVAQEASFGDLIDAVNDDSKVRIVLHVGDIKSGSTTCTDERFAAVRNSFDLLEDPVVYTPGDNEWTDCHRANNGGYDPLERLEAVRSMFFAKPGTTMGRHRMRVDYQRPLIENVRWIESRVAFATLHVIGSNNGLAPYTGLGHTSPTAEQAAEVDARIAAVLSWVDATFDAAEASDLRGVVLAMQADTWDPVPTSGQQAIVDRIATRTAAFDGEVLLLQGDSHEFVADNPLVLPNFTRIVVHGETLPFEYLRLTVNPRDPHLFSWDRVQVATP